MIMFEAKTKKVRLTVEDTKSVLNNHHEKTVQFQLAGTIGMTNTINIILDVETLEDLFGLEKLKANDIVEITINKAVIKEDA